MTAVDPRVGEIENRLSAATPGPWKANKDGTIDGTDYAEVICRGQVDCMSYCYGGTSVIEGDNLASDAEFIAHSPSDVAYLLAELRKRDEALERVERLAIGWHLRGESDMAFSKTLPDEDIAMAILTDGAAKVENARHIRNALKGDGA